jgi:hypothetical protein
MRFCETPSKLEEIGDEVVSLIGPETGSNSGAAYGFGEQVLHVGDVV